MKIAIIIGDKKRYNLKGDITTETLEKQFEIVRPEEAELIVILGGDGSILHVCSEYNSLGIPFYGINRGHIGFLLNEHPADEPNFENIFKQAKYFEFRLLKGVLEFENGSMKTIYAFNEISVEKMRGQAIKLEIQINGEPGLGYNDKNEQQLFCGNGMLVCTPQGSTAYNFNAGGVIMGPNDNLYQMTPIVPVFPLGTRTKVLDSGFKVEMTLVEPTKRKSIVVADNSEFDNVVKLTIEESPKSVKLGFDGLNSYYHKVAKKQNPWMK